MIKLLVILNLILLNACGTQPTACPLDTNDYLTEASKSELHGNAGCWLVKNGNILLVEQRNGLFSFPGGTAEPGETAQCTAYRETLEEAGVYAEVGQLRYQFENGFLLFHCQAEDVSLKTNDSLEIANVLWVNPADLPAKKWRFPEQRKLAIEWLND